MMAANQTPIDGKYYFVSTDERTFRVNRQKIKTHFKITGCRTIQANYIRNVKDDQHPRRWGRIYDFSRTAASAMRYLMLTVTGLIHEFKGKNARSLERAANAVHKVVSLYLQTIVGFLTINAILQKMRMKHSG